MKTIQIPYYQKRDAILWMIKYYKANCEKYKQLAFKQSDIQILIELDSDYVRRYEAELKLLDQIFYN